MEEKKERQYKCRACGKKGFAFEMIPVQIAAKRYSYYHQGECYNVYLQKKKETEEFVYLCKLIRDIHGENNMELPSGFYSLLYDLRNGTVRYVKGGTPLLKNGKREGIPFDILIEAYQIAANDIKKALLRKSFTSRLQAYKYGLAIAKNKIPVVIARRKLKEQKEIEWLREQEKLSESTPVEREFVYKPKHDEDDISDILD